MIAKSSPNHDARALRCARLTEVPQLGRVVAAHYGGLARKEAQYRQHAGGAVVELRRVHQFRQRSAVRLAGGPPLVQRGEPRLLRDAGGRRLGAVENCFSQPRRPACVTAGRPRITLP